MNLKIKNALVSLSDKEDIVSILKILKKYNVKIISSGGTFKYIKKLVTIVLNFLSIPALRKCLMVE